MEISEIKTKFEDQEIFSEEEKKELNIKRKKSGEDSIVFARLFLISHDTFYNNLYLIENEDFKELLIGFTIKANTLRKLIEDLNNTEINTHFKEMKIRDEVDREEMNELIGYFFQVFISGGMFG